MGRIVLLRFLILPLLLINILFAISNIPVAVPQIDFLQRRKEPPQETMNNWVRKHDRDEYENGWVLSIDVDSRVVIVQTDLSRTIVTFKVNGEDLFRFRVGSIVPVTLEDDKAYISGTYVEVVEIKHKSPA